MSKKQSLLSDAIRFLKENHEPTDSWFIKSAWKPAVLPVMQKTAPAPKEMQIVAPIHVEKQVLPKPVLNESIEITPHTTKEVETQKTALLPVEEFAKAVKKHFPRFVLKEAPISNETPYLKVLQAKIVILSLQETATSNLFISNLKKALNAYHLPTECFDMIFFEKKQKEAEIPFFFEKMQADLLITSDSFQKKESFLPFLPKKTLITLDPFETYFTHPEKKQILWQTLCKTLHPLNTQASSSIEL